MNAVYKIIAAIGSSLFFLLIIPSFVPAFAQTASDCVVTDVGKPGDKQVALPAECSGAGGGVGSEFAQKAIELARQEIKKTYVWGAPPRTWGKYDPDKNRPAHYDCSGLVGWAWYWGSGGKVNMAGQTNADWSKGTAGGKFEKYGPDPSKLQPGDIVYFATTAEGKNSPSHVGIYAGKGNCGKDDCFIHIFSSGKPGAEQSLSTRLKPSAYSSKAFSGFLRPVIK